ncbi:MAG: hypothetical protein HY819_11485 [Acidobacteria bacterium]|nr:hypothetical protein [Acidobacteriota bacterium]
MPLLIKITGVIAFLAILINIPVSRLKFDKPSRGWPGGFNTAILAMEFVENKEGLEIIFGKEPSKNRQSIKDSLSYDTVFIILYWALFLCMSILLAQRNLPGTLVIAILAWLLGTIAAGSDFVENYYIKQLINQPLSNQDFSPDSLKIVFQQLRWATLIKWGTSFVSLILLSTIFLPTPYKLSWILVIFSLFFLIGFLGLIGLVWFRLIELSFALMGLGLVTLAISFTFFSESFIKQLNWK